MRNDIPEHKHPLESVRCRATFCLHHHLTMADLPHEIVADILCRLPVKILLCLRCISKSWRSLIDSPQFIFMHLRKSYETNTNNNTNLKLIFRQKSELYEVDFNTLDKAVELNHPLMCYSNRIKVLGSCNGLLCICNVAEDIALWNPSTRKHKILTYLPVDRRPDSETSMFVARVYGFGYDSYSDNYKVLRISYFVDLHDRTFHSQLKLYDLRRNAWKSIESMPYALCCARTMGVFTGGALHWVVTRKLEPNEPDLIVAFDLRFENFREVPLPDTGNEQFEMSVALLGGCLCMIANYQKIRVDVWVMKKYGFKQGWLKLFTLTQTHDLKSFESVKPITYSSDGNKILFELEQRKLCWYDLRNKGLSYLRISGMPPLIEAVSCQGSLVPPAIIETKFHGKQKKLCHEKAKKKRDRQRWLQRLHDPNIRGQGKDDLGSVPPS